MPSILRRLGFDPAASSAPSVATLVDVTGLCIYFFVAVLILQGCPYQKPRSYGFWLMKSFPDSPNSEASASPENEAIGVHSGLNQ
jgi:hypothetical protein